jgi:nucleoside 2-deoxyribosyltransferase
MDSRAIYLAGPIGGTTKGEANNWRDDMICRLADMGMRGISPLRCEPLIGERYNTSGYNDPKFGTDRAIASKNMMDVQMCDLTLCYFPQDVTEQYGVSLGTVCEIAWAKALSKPTILVSTHAKVINHPVIGACAGWVLPSLDDALEVIEGIFTDYVRPVHDLQAAHMVKAGRRSIV